MGALIDLIFSTSSLSLRHVSVMDTGLEDAILVCCELLVIADDDSWLWELTRRPWEGTFVVGGMGRWKCCG